MRIAIIGAGISGLTAAYYLYREHEVTVFEAGEYVGGHTNTIQLESRGKLFAVDTGFIVFNDRTYPNFIRLLGEIGVASQPTSMSFSVSCERTGLEYRGADLSGFFAQRRNLFNWRFYRLLRDLLRFNRRGLAFLERNEELTVREFFARESFSREFIEQYFLPMGSAVWSCPHGVIEEFPVRFMLEFYKNHGLLSVNDRPQWRVIQGGSQSYIAPLTRGFAERIHLRSSIEQVQRSPERVVLMLRDGSSAAFDQVIFACHSDQALQILGAQATSVEQELLSAFPYEPNETVLHTDASVLPHCKRAWACWNYRVPRHDPGKATVTYNMNMLQSLRSEETFCVTLNATQRIDPAKIIRRFTYHHPIFTLQRAAAQRRHTELLGANRTSFCGAYWGNGFHEDGVNSALAVCQALGVKRGSPQVAQDQGSGV